MVEVFMENLSALPESRRKLVNAAATGPAGIRSARAAVVRSAFEIKPAQRAAIEQGVLQCLGPEVAVRFERSSQLVCGVELTLDDVKLAWSVTDYLSRVVQEILELTAATAVPTPEARHG
jgi:F-type H+-transporting ATPase subunit b